MHIRGGVMVSILIIFLSMADSSDFAAGRVSGFIVVRAESKLASSHCMAIQVPIFS